MYDNRKYHPATNLILIFLENGSNINLQNVITSLVSHILLYVIYLEIVCNTNTSMCYCAMYNCFKFIHQRLNCKQVNRTSRKVALKNRRTYVTPGHASRTQQECIWRLGKQKLCLTSHDIFFFGIQDTY